MTQKLFILLPLFFLIVYQPLEAEYSPRLLSSKPKDNQVFWDTLVSKGSSSKKNKILNQLKNMVLNTKQIHIPGFPNAFNPSLIPDGDGYILTFRVTPEKESHWVSYVGIVNLNKSFELISDIQILNPRQGKPEESPSQAEDARIFSFRGDLYLIYNDNDTVVNPSKRQRRDMYIAKLTWDGSLYHLETPLKLMHENKYKHVRWQKNWTPFVWNDNLMISYRFKPHEVLMVDMETGICKTCHQITNPTRWSCGELRGGTTSLLIDGEYLTFFHSSTITKSIESKEIRMRHYYMGALTFKARPPFEVTKMTPAPIIGKNFYTISDFDKRVVFPAGFAVDGDKIYVVYGKDDSEIWVATISRNTLKQTLLPPKFKL